MAHSTMNLRIDVLLLQQRPLTFFQRLAHCLLHPAASIYLVTHQQVQMGLWIAVAIDTPAIDSSSA